MYWICAAAFCIWSLLRRKSGLVYLWRTLLLAVTVCWRVWCGHMINTHSATYCKQARPFATLYHPLTDIKQACIRPVGAVTYFLEMGLKIFKNVFETIIPQANRGRIRLTRFQKKYLICMYKTWWQEIWQGSLTSTPAFYKPRQQN